MLETVYSNVNTYLERDILELIDSDSVTFMKFLMSAAAGNMFETFIVSEVLKSFSNEGMDYRFSVFFYRGKDKDKGNENEIDLVIEENGILYPVKIKMSANPKASMASAKPILDKVDEKKRGMGVILCLIEKKTYLRENLIALPIEYI